MQDTFGPSFPIYSILSPLTLPLASPLWIDEKLLPLQLAVSLGSTSPDNPIFWVKK
jgi:hypothetical protein